MISNKLSPEQLAAILDRLNRRRLLKFIKISMEANQQYVDVAGSTMTTDERLEHELVLNQGAFLARLLGHQEALR